MKTNFFSRDSTLLISCVFLLIISITAASSVHALAPLAVKGNQIVNAETGKRTVLRGVNGPSMLWPCIFKGTEGYGFWDAAIGTDEKVIRAIKSWNVGVVRTAINELCWLGGSPSLPTNKKYTGAPYRKELQKYVNLLNANGIYVIIELHWTTNGSSYSTQQRPMPDAEYAPAMWRSVASTFKNSPGVLFDLFNEPFPQRNSVNSDAAWKCWRDGGYSCTDIASEGWQAVGMQGLVDAVRSVGAQNVVLLGGINYANGLYQWLSFRPRDPSGNNVAAWHSYSKNACSSQACWNSVIKPLAAHVPVITSELGEVDCRGIYIKPLLKWLDSELGTSAGALAWAFDDYGSCTSQPALVTNATTGECTVTYGCDFKEWLLSKQ